MSEKREVNILHMYKGAHDAVAVLFGHTPETTLAKEPSMAYEAYGDAADILEKANEPKPPKPPKPTEAKTGQWQYNPIFNLGRIVATPEAMRLLGQNVVDVLISHADLEQGELGDEDHNLNVQAVEVASRIFSKFKVDGASFYVITEWDRSLTTVLLPEEY